MPYTPGINDGYGPVLGAPASDPADVSQIDFMNLLVAQIQNQDPLSPMDNAQFTGQITQFTMLEELQTMSRSIAENIMVSQSINNTAMLGLVGKQVTVEGNGVSVTGGVPSETVVAAGGPGRAVVEVTDATGHVVATYAEDVDAGLTTISWDGNLDDGSLAEDGDYTVSITVTSGEMEVPFTTLMTGAVEGLRYENNLAIVMVGGREYYVSDIYKVS